LLGDSSESQINNIQPRNFLFVSSKVELRGFCVIINTAMKKTNKKSKQPSTIEKFFPKKSPEQTKEFLNDEEVDTETSDSNNKFFAPNNEISEPNNEILARNNEISEPNNEIFKSNNEFFEPNNEISEPNKLLLNGVTLEKNKLKFPKKFEQKIQSAISDSEKIDQNLCDELNRLVNSFGIFKFTINK
jgi:hypothetical protein